MDFGHFGDGAFVPRDQQGPPTPQNGTGPGSVNGNSTGTAEQPIFMHTMEHPAVTCDVCNGAIRGFRYKCLQCQDFDLCTGCERKGNHPGHVMMRIAFPEQSRDAIRRYIGTAPGCGVEGRPGGLFGVGFPFGIHGHRERGSHRRGAHGTGHGPASGRDSDGDSEDPKAPNDCPYGLGRKGMKKWSKCMKKMAYQQRRSAEAYAKSAAHAAAGASCAGAAAAAGSTDTRGATDAQAFDFTAAASQIQEFLNAFGIPIDVVELYDNFGNRGQPRADGTPAQPEPATAAAGNSTSQNVAGATTNATVGASSNVQASPIGFESVAGPANLATHMQQLHLNGAISSNQRATAETVVAPSAPADSSSQAMTIDLDADSTGWTLLDTERNPNAASVGGQQNAANEGSTSLNCGPSATAGVSNGNPENSANIASATPSAAPAPGGRLYPGLNPPQLQQLLSGVSQAMNSMVRNIPIVTNPSGPAVGENSGPPSGNAPEMDVRCTTTLNQLLAMGFSNHDGWLSRLVVAKNGELEAVLNALFPVGRQ